MAMETGQAYKVSMPNLRPPLLALVIFALAACGNDDSPEQQVRAVFDRMERAAESRSVGDLMEHVSADYRGANDQHPDEASRYVRGYFIANRSIHLLTRVDQLEFPSDDEARAKVLVGMVGREADSSAAWNLAADLYELDVVLIREGGDWKVTYAEWGQR